MFDKGSHKQQVIKALIQQLDEAGRRDFIAFTLGQRRPHLHRLFVVASRRAYLARLAGFATTFSDLAKAIKKSGHEDATLCHGAAEFAHLLTATETEVRATAKAVGTPDEITEAALMWDAPGVQARRAAGAAAEAAEVTAEDIDALGASEAMQEAVFAASRHSVFVIATAYQMDARASARLGSAVAMANVEVATDKAQDEQLKWLKRRLPDVPPRQKSEMPRSTPPSLAFSLGYEFVVPFIEKGLLGGPYLRFFRFLELGLWLYLTGAVLGRARHDRFEALARMFSDPGRESEVCDFLRDEALKRLQEYGREPDSFVDFFMQTEFRRVGLKCGDPNDMKRADKGKIPLGAGEGHLKMFMLEGTGFGASFPELMERMWRQTYETERDSEMRAALIRAGLDVPQEWTALPLKQREQEVLLQVAAYATEYYPELVEPLGLRLAGEPIGRSQQEREEQAPTPGQEKQPTQSAGETQPSIQEQRQAFLRAKRGRTQDRKPPP